MQKGKRSEDIFNKLTNAKLPKNRSRYIPADVQRVVKERHFFQCAWDGERLFDQHHIFEFAEGGEHTADNLILLCPNCHRRVHKG